MPESSRAPEHLFVAALILDGSDRLLLLQRSRSARFAPGKWGLPGGHLGAGEDPEAGMHRELDEELGPDLRLDLDLKARLGPLPTEGLARPGGIHLFRYRCRGGFPKLNGEHTRWEWVSREAYPSYPVMVGVDADLAYLGVWK